ncbi:MAG: pyridoxamine 5'-phosphate oxidase family protein [Pseudomonadota bacterium]
MGEQFKALDDKHIEFIGNQHLFFVGTAAAEGLINVSPKGMDTFRVIDASRVAWLNLTGSGNETAAHVREQNRMTIMFCSFDKHPRILRLYGKAKVVHPRDAEWQEHIDRFPEFTGARQVFDVQLDMVQTSCGYAVPYYELKGERPTLTKWADNRGRSGIEDYWQERNTESLDQKPTGIAEDG